MIDMNNIGSNQNKLSHKIDNRISRRRFFELTAVTALGVSIVGLAGCSGESKSTSQSDLSTSSASTASTGGTLTMLNFADWMGENEVATFADKFGFEIEELPTPEGGSTAWINALTQGKGTYDFALAGNNTAARLEENGLLAKFDASNVPNMSKIPEDVKKTFPYGMPVEQGKVGFIYNKSILPSPPTSFKELFEKISSPELSGKVVFPSYDGDVLNSGLLACGYSVNDCVPEQIDEARDKIIAIKPHVKAFVDSGAADQVVDGSAAIAIAYDYDFAFAAAESDDLAWLAPDEGCPGYMDGWVIMADSQNIDAVYEFFNFHLEDDNYADFINTTWSSWVMPSIKDKLDDEVKNCDALDPEKNEKTFITLEQPWKIEAYARAWQEIQNA